MKKNIKKFCISAIMIALSTVLSLLKIPIGPMGGSITLLSMLPISLIGIWYGTYFAFFPCVLYAVLQMFVDGFLGWGLTPAILVGSMFFDYIFAYGSVCLSGVFKKRKHKEIWGIVLVCAVRFLCHFISGIIFFRTFKVFNNPIIWSAVYNGSFMLPEMILTVIGMIAVKKTGIMEKLGKMI